MTNTTMRTRLLGVGLLAAIFVAGGLAGAAVHQVRDASEDGGARPEQEREAPQERPCRQPYGYLELTPDQRERVDGAFERRRQQLDAFWDDNGPRYESIVDSTRAEFRSVLTADQLVEYDRRRSEHQKREEGEREERRQREQECDRLRQQQQNGEKDR